MRCMFRERHDFSIDHVSDRKILYAFYPSASDSVLASLAALVLQVVLEVLEVLGAAASVMGALPRGAQRFLRRQSLPQIRQSLVVTRPCLLQTWSSFEGPLRKKCASVRFSSQ